MDDDKYIPINTRKGNNRSKRTTLCNILKANTRLAYLGHVLEDLDIDITNLNLRNDLKDALADFNTTT